MRRTRWVVIGSIATVLAFLWASVAQGSLLADTSFEVAQGYPASPPQVDIRTLIPTDGLGWGHDSQGIINKWAGSNGGADYTFVATGGAYDGSQYLAMHRSDSKILLRRKFDTTQIIDGRIIFSFAMRLDTQATAAPYFQSSLNVAIERNNGSGGGHEGDKNAHIEFTKDGVVIAKGPDAATSTTVGNWDNPAGTMYARNTWATVVLDVDIVAERYDFHMNGNWIGNFKFRTSLSVGQMLDQIRFWDGPRGLDGNPNDGSSIDAIRLNTGFDEIIAPCMTNVRPGTVSATANVGEPADPSSIVYTIRHLGSQPQPIEYEVTKVDQNGEPASYDWLKLPPDGTTGSIPAGGSATVTASIDTTGLAGGNYLAYLKFADRCDPTAHSHIRQVNLAVIACQWTVDSCNQVRSYLPAYSNPAAGDYRGYLDDAIYTIKNVGQRPFDYTVATEFTSSTCTNWVTLVNGSGSIAVGQQIQVTAKLDPSVLAACTAGNSYTCRLHVTDNCSDQEIIREILVRSMNPADSCTFTYLGNLDPQMDDSAGEGLTFAVEEGVANGSAESMAGAQDDKAWHINDPAGTKSKYQIRSWSDSDQQYHNIGIWGEVGATILGRFKVNTVVGTRAGGLFVWERENICAEYHWGGPDGVIKEVVRGVEASVPGSADQWVTARLTVIGHQDNAWDCGRTVRLYLDENPQPIIEIASAAESGDTARHEGLGFGAGSTAGAMDIAFDWVTGTNVGAFAPGEEESVLGFSLVPDVCPRPFADADGDHDVDQVDFGIWQTCFTGPSSPSTRPECVCFDRNGDGYITSADFIAFQACFRGPSVPADPDCGG